MRAFRPSLVLLGPLVVGLAVSGCAAPGGPSGSTPSATADAGFNDPFENTNRAIFGFNQSVDRAVLVPVAKAYRDALPPPMRKALHDFLQNLDEPVIFANDVLQGRLPQAAGTLGRLAINTTVGIGGIIDVATGMGIPYHSNDFGITLATWGFVQGPYLIVPILGPMTTRALVGQIGDSFADPGDYVASQHNVWVAILARHGTAGIDLRSRNIESLAEIEKTALDYYATIRSLYRQRRAAEIHHEESNLPNPGLGGGDAGPEPAISYSVAPPSQPSGAPAK
jgi:phospholipid-binding lipoprotein MlaA